MLMSRGILAFMLLYCCTFGECAKGYCCKRTNGGVFCSHDYDGGGGSQVNVSINLPCGRPRLSCFEENGGGDHYFNEQDVDNCYWRFTRDAVTKFWCAAYWIAPDGGTAATMYNFPVFGGEVVGKSQEWAIDGAQSAQVSVDGGDPENLGFRMWSFGNPKYIDPNNPIY